MLGRIPIPSTMPQTVPHNASDVSPRRKIIELRELLASKFPASCARPPARMLTGVDVLDDLLGGGLAKAALTEVICPLQSAGSGTLIHALIEAAKSSKQPLGLVDGANSFDPDGLQNDQLASLLWVQCMEPKQAIQAADLLLRDGNLALVILDLVMCPVRDVQAIPSSSWYRLQRVTEGNGSVALVFTPIPVVASAACTLRLDHGFELPALDRLRDQLTASLHFQTVHSRAGSTRGSSCFLSHQQNAPR